MAKAVAAVTKQHISINPTSLIGFLNLDIICCALTDPLSSQESTAARKSVIYNEAFVSPFLTTILLSSMS